MAFSDTVQDKILPVVMKFINAKPVVAIKEGMMYIMPLSIVGSVFLLLAEFPWAPIKNFFANMGWSTAMYQVNNATMGIMGLVAVVSIAYAYARNEGHEPLAAGVAGLVSFMILLEWNIPVEGVEGGATGVPTNWIGSQGIVAALIIGISVGFLYSLLLEKDVRIKMPESVPSGVSNAFSALIPVALVALISSIIYGILNSMGTSFLDIIYTALQVPLQGLSDSLGMAIIHPLAVHFLWWFGIHGAVTVGAIVEPILRANLAENLELFRAGELSIENGANILTVANTNVFQTPTGSGLTIGIVVFMLFFAKSQQFKTLGRLALPSSLFNINEPIIFGTPIVMNPLLMVPFILVPTLGNVFGYFLIATGILPPAMGVEVPWTTPPIIQGFLVGGWKWAVAQFVVIVMSIAIYYPFMKAIDDRAYAEEQEGLLDGTAQETV